MPEKRKRETLAILALPINTELMILDIQNTLHFHQEVVIRYATLNIDDTVFVTRGLLWKTALGANLETGFF